MNIEASKLELIKLIADVQSEQLVEQLKKMVKFWEKKAAAGNGAAFVTPLEREEPEWLRLAKQPMPEHISLEELAKQQNYSGEKLRQAFQEWDYSLFEDQSLEELLNSLTP